MQIFDMLYKDMHKYQFHKFVNCIENYSKTNKSGFAAAGCVGLDICLGAPSWDGQTQAQCESLQRNVELGSTISKDQSKR